MTQAIPFEQAVYLFVQVYRERQIEKSVRKFANEQIKRQDSDEPAFFDASRDDDDWITIKGTHVLLNEEGVAQSGGKIAGKKFANAKSHKSVKRYQRPAVQDKSIKKIAKKTALLKNEQYRIIDKDGNVILEKKGDKHSVSATVGEKRQLLNGAASIHNHPSGGTFSPEDLSDFGFGATEMFVASPEGTYTLTNVKHGTPEQSAGWLAMREEIQKQIPETSAMALIKQARANLADSHEAKEMKRINSEYMKMHDSGASKEELNEYYKSSGYDEYAKIQKENVEKEVRRLEVEPFHEFYKNHAAEYGFKYTFEPLKKDASDSINADGCDSQKHSKIYDAETLAALFQLNLVNQDGAACPFS